VVKKNDIIYIIIGIILLALIMTKIGVKEKLSIYEDTNVPYNNQYFTECNPCPWTIVVYGENTEYAKVIFDTYATYTEGTGREVACVPIEDRSVYVSGIGYRDEWWVATRQRSTFCQMKGYTDVVYEKEWCDRSYDCAKYADKNCIGDTVNCYRWKYTTTDWIELRDGSEVIALYDGEEHKEVDLASQVDKYCGGQISDCKINSGMCDYECPFTIYAYSENNGGSFSFVPNPVRLVPVTTTTSSTSTTTTTTTTTSTTSTTTIITTTPTTTITTTVTGEITTSTTYPTTTTTIPNGGDDGFPLWILILIPIVLIGISGGMR